MTTVETRRYFIPGLLAKFLGAIALGCIYQFYYGGGDTLNYHSHGSIWIWKAIWEKPTDGLFLLFSKGGDYQNHLYKYTSHIWYYGDVKSFFIVRIAAFFDLFTGATYTATALFFASFAFLGQWFLFSTFNELRFGKTKYLAFACLFVPSTIFWGSGILKDTITFGALCWLTALTVQVFVMKKNSLIRGVLMVFMAWLIFTIKLYILLCFIVAVSVFLFFQYQSRIKSTVIKVLSIPFLLIIFLAAGYVGLEAVAQEDSRYSLDQVAKTAQVTAYDIRYGWGARNGDNSGYTLGELDGTFGSLIKLAPAGVIVTLFRPWLWEVKNPLMLLSAIESLVFLFFTLKAFQKVEFNQFLKQPVLVYCLVFALMFAFAVGVSTFNFGTLMRYKIPVIPFYSIVLVSLISNPVRWREN